MAALKYWKSVLQWFFILLIIGFLLYTLYMNLEELKGYHLSSATIAVSALMEEFLNIFSTLLLYVCIFFLVSHATLSSYAFYLFLFLPIPFVLMHPKIFQWFIHYIAK